MDVSHGFRLGLLALAAAVLAGCSDGQPTAPVARAATPLPPYPAWALGMIGKSVTVVLPKSSKCDGAFDLVSMLHTGAHPGVQVEGWGWATELKKPLLKVLFVTPDRRIVGAGVGGALRSDVPPAMPNVTSPNVGWKGSAGVDGGMLIAVGIPADGVRCDIGSPHNIGKDLRATADD